MQFAFSSVISKLVYGLLLSGAYKFLEFIMCKTSDAQVSAGSGDSSVEYQKWMHLIPKLLEFANGEVSLLVVLLLAVCIAIYLCIRLSRQMAELVSLLQLRSFLVIVEMFSK